MSQLRKLFTKRYWSSRGFEIHPLRYVKYKQYKLVSDMEAFCYSKRMNEVAYSAVYKECLDYFYRCSDLFYSATKEKFLDRDEQLFVTMASCLNTAKGVHTLASSPQTENESIMLMRALLEKLINYNYLRTTSAKEYDSYWLYPYYRMYHNTKQSLSGGRGSIRVELNGNSVEELRKHLKIKRSLEVFSDTNARMNWTEKTFNERLKEVALKSKLNESILLINSLLTYRSASESLHGSLYGLMQLTGIFEVNSKINLPDVGSEQVRINIESGLGFRIVLLGYLMSNTVRSLAIDYKNVSLKNESVNLMDEMSEIIKKIDEFTD